MSKKNKAKLNKEDELEKNYSDGIDSKYENKDKILIFFISIYVFYSFNRYSNFGGGS